MEKLEFFEALLKAIILQDTFGSFGGKSVAENTANIILPVDIKNDLIIG